MATKNTKTTKTTSGKSSTARKASSAKATTRKAPSRSSAKTCDVCAVETCALADEYRPISMWGYLVWEIIYVIPVIGWIVCVGQAFCANNRNLRNFARSQFCWLIIWLIVVCALAGLGVFANLVNALGLI